ncbi:hypothetical protein H0H87_008250 [Tephrocybe sp. NHM501043]|nr:hypothetical protein H0H87_008250 [Tephrocybe sp. NHM501043]
MATLTVTAVQHTRPRARTLSLIVGKSLLVSLLPAELFLLILEHAILYCKPKALALVSKAFRRGIDVIIYRTVVLDSLKTLLLFHRTIHSERPSFSADHVKKIVVIDRDIALHPHFNDVLAACSSIRSLSIHSYNRPGKPSTTKPTIENGLIMPQSTMLRLLDDLTHLRFCEPGELWCSPAAMIAAFGSLPNLSHLQLARRINANQANDKIFVRSVFKLLVSRPILKMLVVSIFSDNGSCIEQSEIWHQMCELRCTDQRLIVVPGRYDEWKEGWNDKDAIRSGWHPRDFWLHVSM